ncbi:hypothetical protein P8H27_07760 [Pseudomonas sp. sp1636]|uniref:hypothetical protein n=1 Tax=Pseudomonas sp. sp1636 TaxID=3036707 RepID=UPI0025A5A062|nr:hypothetical protein [Pseudomonas sp. sp1636]MDM8348795.1 hypothetical protein [Pseudomonas sp. sp1636]
MHASVCAGLCAWRPFGLIVEFKPDRYTLICRASANGIIGTDRDRLKPSAEQTVARMAGQ